MNEEYENQGVNPVAIVRSCLHNTLNPLLNTFRRSEKEDSGESSLLKRVADLDMALVHYEQNLDIPDVHLNFPPFLVEAGNKCRAAGRLLSSSELGWSEKPSSDMLNQLMRLKGQWMRDIHKLTEHTRELKRGTTLQEINYWSVLRGALEKVNEALQSYEVQVLFSVLKSSNMIVSAGSFEITTGMKAKLEDVVGNVELLSGIPMNSLLASSDFATVRTIVEQIFTQLKKVKNARGYSISRTVDLVNSINKDVFNQCMAVLSSQRVFNLTYSHFSSMMNDAASVFKTWEDETVSFWQFLMELGTRRNDKASLKFQNTLVPLEERLKVIQAFRDMHERFVTILQQVLSTQEQDRDLVHQVMSAYERFRPYNVSDLSESALNEWELLMKEYNATLDQVDQSLVDTLRTRLENARSTEQMFDVFSRYNALFFRPRIQGGCVGVV